MRLPNRKPGKYTFKTFDLKITAIKFKALQQQLEHIKTVALPQAIKDTQKHAENGDFSENAEYQIAKGRLRGLNQAVTELQYQVDHAIIIEEPSDTTTVQIGHTVTLAVNQAQVTYKILGSSETNPAAGIISYQSPLGAALLNHTVGETITVQTGTKKITYKIEKIS
ncbi:MAG: GreA/GreB family elongation factor [Patescibacteria group bacterium]|jgi:transcription elongation factor GreA